VVGASISYEKTIIQDYAQCELRKSGSNSDQDSENEDETFFIEIADYTEEQQMLKKNIIVFKYFFPN
jgi:hypothetical protein